MAFDDWGISDARRDEYPDLDEYPKWTKHAKVDPNWADNQKEIALAFDILVHTSDKAYLLQFGERDVWFPKSKATINMSIHKNTVTIPKWLMIKKGLEEYCVDILKPEEATEVEKLFDKVVRKNIKSLEEDIPL